MVENNEDTYTLCVVADILEEFENQVSSLKVKCSCLGGGRIEHKPENKYIKVYGYSQVGFFV